MHFFFLFCCIFVVTNLNLILHLRNGTIATDLVFLFKAVEKLDAIRCRWPATKSSFDRGECTKNLSPKMYFPRSFLNLQNENAIQSIKIFEATSPITYTTVCKCISIENNGTEVDHTNLDFLNVKHVDFRISTSTKVMLHQKYVSKKWSHGLHYDFCWIKFLTHFINIGPIDFK